VSTTCTQNNEFEKARLSTHYAVIACLFENCPPVDFLGDRQHEILQPMSISELLSHPVHAFMRNHFVPDTPNLFLGAACPGSFLAPWKLITRRGQV
jgi:hypothetical protein